MNDLTAVVLTWNEEAFIIDCLESLQWCDHVLVMASYSTDRTVELARQYGAQVVQRKFVDFADQRNASIDLVRTDWIFFVDADERVTPELAEEIQSAIHDQSVQGWWIPRKNNLFGKWLQYGGFYPDYHLRLARKGQYSFDPQRKVHEQADLVGKTGYLHQPLLHIWYQNWGEMLATRSKYATLLAESHYKMGLRPTYQLLAAPIFVFFKQLIVLNSYKDGRVGFLISLVWGYDKFLEYWRVWGMRIAANRDRLTLHNPDPC